MIKIVSGLAGFGVVGVVFLRVIGVQGVALLTAILGVAGVLFAFLGLVGTAIQAQAVLAAAEEDRVPAGVRPALRSLARAVRATDDFRTRHDLVSTPDRLNLAAAGGQTIALLGAIGALALLVVDIGIKTLWGR